MKKSKLQILFICLFGLLFMASCGQGTELTVTFKIDEDTQIVQSLKWGDKIEIPEVPTKEGYTFVGWNEEVPNIMPSKSLEFTAIYEVTKYTITYKIEGMEDVVQKYEFGAEVTPLENVEKEGYTFVGWDQALPETMPTQNLEVNAKFVVNTYTITYQVEGMDDKVVDYAFGTPIVSPENPVVVGKVFMNWDQEIPETMPAKDLVIKAVFSDKSYTITYKVEGMEDVIEAYIEGSFVNQPTSPVKEGYTFTGWDQEVPEIMPGKDLVLCATFSKNAYTLTFKAEGLDDVVVTYFYGDVVAAPEAPVKEGYTFVSWDKELPHTMPAENLEFVATFVAKMYKVTYKGIGMDDIVQEYSAGATIQLPKNPYRNGFVFDGWLETVPSVMPANDLEFTAKFIQDRDYEGVVFIGHAGCYSGIMNTETAFINAAKSKGYLAIECDLKQTKDGVFVVCHDDTFGGVAINSTNWADLKDVTVTSTRGGIKYTSTICTLARYLEICKEYQVYPLIELKYSQGINNNDQSRMGALMAEIEKAGMLNQVMFLASQYKCLEWVRNNGYSDIPCQYLVNSGDSETVYNRCVQWRFDVSINIGSTNTQEWIDRYHAAGLKVSTYTFNQYQTAQTLQKWIDMGVDYVTCDILTEKDVTLPDYESMQKLPKYTVKFYDWDGTLLKELVVKEGKGAGAPLDPKRTGYTFTGWDLEFSKVMSNLEIKATYAIANYEIVYNANLNLIEEASWSTKEEFVNEFYQDWFNWLVSRLGKLNGLTKNGDTYTLVVGTGNNNTAVFANFEDLKKLDVYVVERTIGTLVYKPIKGTNSADYIMEEDANYFLNTEPYRTKYKDMNRYFLNVLNTAYTSYNKNYEQSSGRVQIFFRFHQWQKGTNIPSFNTLPKKFNVTIIENVNPQLPKDHLTYTYEDSFILTDASCEGYKFVGWYTDQACTEENKVTEIAKGTTGKIILFAKWEKVE